MATKSTQRYCKQCKSDVLAIKEGPNHVLHLILSLITVGVWVVVWFLAGLFQKLWRCSRCGKRLQF